MSADTSREAVERLAATLKEAAAFDAQNELQVRAKWNAGLADTLFALLARAEKAEAERDAAAQEMREACAAWHDEQARIADEEMCHADCPAHGFEMWQDTREHHEESAIALRALPLRGEAGR
jgi:hypothetical protein